MVVYIVYNIFSLFLSLLYLVPKVKVKSPSFDARLIWDRQPCRIQFTPMSKNGYRYPELILTELFRGFNPGGKFELKSITGTS